MRLSRPLTPGGGPRRQQTVTGVWIRQLPARRLTLTTALQGDSIMAASTRLGLALASVFVLLLHALPAAAQRGAVPEVSAAPGVFAERAISACSNAINAQVQTSGGVLVEPRAGSEQDGYILVSGRVTWRSDARAEGPFACIWQRAGNRVAALDLPDRPPVADPGRGASGSGAPGGRPITQALITRCTDAVHTQIQRDHRVAPTLQGSPAAEQRAGTTVLAGAGAFSSGRASASGRTTGQRAFTYVCELDLSRQTVTNVAVRVP